MKLIEEIISEVLKNRGKNYQTTINSSTRLREDLGMDSLDLAELTVKIEAEYGVDIFEDGIVNTIEEIRKKLG